MNCVNIAFVGSIELASAFGKAGTKSDIQFYNYKTSQKSLNLIHAFSFPEKITSLVQALNMGNIALVEVNSINPELGEVIILLKLLEKKTYFLLNKKNEYLISQLEPLIKGINYETRVIKEQKELVSLKDEFLNMDFSKKGETLVEIDHFFNVKSVGIVALGVLKQGTLDSRNQITLYPQKKPVQIKSIQVMDEDVKSADSQARVGLSLKNCTLEELERGSILSLKELEVKTNLKSNLNKVEYYKKEITKGEQLILVHSLQVIPCNIKDVSGSSISLELLKPLTYISEKSILLEPSGKGLRVIGSV